MPLPATDFYYCNHSAEQMNAATLDLLQWPDGDFPWTLMDDLPRVNSDELKKAADRGLSRWKDTKRVAPRYVLNAREARLLIYTAAIDGPGKVLADCQLPSPGQKQVVMRLDIGEDWGTDLSSLQRQIALELVIWHEGGHGLGLGHAPQGSANIMAPIYNVKQLFLGSWDLSEIAARYKREIVTTQPTPTVPVPAGGDGGIMGGLFSVLTKMGPVLIWLKDNGDKIPMLLAALKSLFDAFQAAQPAKLLLASEAQAEAAQLNLERSTLAKIIEYGLAELEIFAALTTTTADDNVVAFLKTAMATPWLLDFISNILNGKMALTPAMLQQALLAQEVKK